MSKIIKLGLVLLVITSVAGLILGFTNDLTQGIIQERALAETRVALEALMPEADDFSIVEGIAEGNISDVYEGLKSGDIIGYTIKVHPQGYGGAIEMLVGISSEGRITGVKIGENSETPGVGSKVADASFVDQFLGKETGNDFIITKGGETGDEYIQAISGATVSSTAVVEGVNEARALFVNMLKDR